MSNPAPLASRACTQTQQRALCVFPNLYSGYSEGFSFLSGGLGAGRFGFGNGIVHGRGTDSVCPMRCALRIGVDRGPLGGDLSHCAVGICGGRVASDPLCRWHWLGGRRVGGGVPLGAHSVAELWRSVA